VPQPATARKARRTVSSCFYITSRNATVEGDLAISLAGAATLARRRALAIARQIGNRRGEARGVLRIALLNVTRKAIAAAWGTENLKGVSWGVYCPCAFIKMRHSVKFACLTFTPSVTLLFYVKSILEKVIHPRQYISTEVWHVIFYMLERCPTFFFGPKQMAPSNTYPLANIDYASKVGLRRTDRTWLV